MFKVKNYYGTLNRILYRALHTLAFAIDDSTFATRGTDLMGESCVLSALISRDFFKHIGFKGAEARAVVLKANCIKGGRIVRDVSFGDPNQAHRVRKVSWEWHGHLVVTIPEEGILVDYAVSPLLRDEWRQVILRGIIIPLEHQSRKPGSHGLLAQVQEWQDAGLMTATWESYADGTWRKTPDAKRRSMRADAVKYLAHLYQHGGELTR